jgi:hypothetical protein
LTKALRRFAAFGSIPEFLRWRGVFTFTRWRLLHRTAGRRFEGLWR